MKLVSGVADYVINKINDYKPNPEKPFVLGLPTGSSPIESYKKIIRRYKAGDISFKNVVTFNMGIYWYSGKSFTKLSFLYV